MVRRAKAGTHRGTRAETQRAKAGTAVWSQRHDGEAGKSRHAQGQTRVGNAQGHDGEARAGAVSKGRQRAKAGTRRGGQRGLGWTRSGHEGRDTAGKSRLLKPNGHDGRVGNAQGRSARAETAGKGGHAQGRGDSGHEGRAGKGKARAGADSEGRDSGQRQAGWSLGANGTMVRHAQGQTVWPRVPAQRARW